MAESADADLKARLVEVMREGGRVQQAYVAALSAEERAATGTPARWSAKDLVAHLTAWKARRLRQMEAVTRGEAAPALPIQETNEATWDELAGQSWHDALAEEARVTAALAALVEGMAEADLLATGRYPSLPYQPAALVAMRPAYPHVIQHLAEHAIEAGDLAGAIALRQAAATALDAFPEFPELAAAPHYNLALHYVTAGQPERALAELRRAFTWNPQLAPAAREDEGLAALREDARYQALVEER